MDHVALTAPLTCLLEVTAPAFCPSFPDVLDFSSLYNLSPVVCNISADQGV